MYIDKLQAILELFHAFFWRAVKVLLQLAAVVALFGIFSAAGGELVRRVAAVGSQIRCGGFE